MRDYTGLYARLSIGQKVGSFRPTRLLNHRVDYLGLPAMDALDSPQYPSGPAPGMEAPKPGRPAMDAQKRALADDRYSKMLELIETLPKSATEFRFAIFRARRNSEAKSSFRPLEKVYYSKFSAENFGDEGTLGAYLLEKYGPGKYFIEALDEHNQRIVKIPSYTVFAGNEDDMEDDEYDDDEPRSGWRRGRRRRYEDDDEDDPREARANMADLLSTVGKQNAAQVATVAKGSNDMLSVLLLTQQSNQEARAAEERRRDEMRQEERKREEDRAEARRAEQERERAEREEREQRRREDDRRDREAAEARRAQENVNLMQAANKRTEILVAAVTAAAPVLGRLFEKKEDTTLPLLFKSLEKKDDPVMLMLLKGMMDKAHDDSASKNMILQMGEMSKITTQMGADQMRSVMAMSNDINGTIMKKAMEMMLASPQGQTTEGKSVIEQVMAAVAGAADIVKTLVPQQAPAQQQARITHQAAPVQATVVETTPAQASAPVPEKTKTQAEWDAMTPEQRQEMAHRAPTGATAVIQSIYAIQNQQYGNQAEYQQLIQYLVTEMPLDLRVAVLNGDEASVMSIMAPIVQATPQLGAWIIKPGVMEWIRQFVSQLPPSLEGVYGPAQAQRDQLAAALAAQQAAAVAPAATPDATPAPTGEAAPAPTETAADGTPIIDVTPAVETAPVAEAAPEPIAAQAAAASAEASHLDPDAP